ncbi:hypothetical protein HW49_01310 [Porphyromonadaceae bacterium COT-184 OH4590]|nr:hypothetical protein HW49_01310 [Porphyromonadaceae bacterium COT-184 OH4590]
MIINNIQNVDGKSTQKVFLPFLYHCPRLIPYYFTLLSDKRGNSTKKIASFCYAITTIIKKESEYIHTYSPIK